MSKRLLALVLALLCLFVPVTLATSAVSEPNNPMVAAAQRAIAESVGQDTAGAAVILIENGRLLMREGFGYADIGDGSSDSRFPVISQSVFEIGRLSGIFVAIAAYRLAEQGALDLHADIAKYLPEDFMRQLALKDKVNVHQLLCGTAGFGGRTFDLMFDSDFYCFETLEQALLSEVPEQIAEPDSYYSYSEFGIALAALVVQTVAGQDYAAYVKEHILTPLGMENTYLFVTEKTQLENPVKGHTSPETGRFAVADKGGRSYFGLYPANGALSGLSDLAALMQFLLYGREGAVLSDSSRTAMLTAAETDSVFSLSAPALNLRGTAVGIETSTRYFSAALWLDTVGGKGALTLANTPDTVLHKLPAALCGTVLGTTVTPSDSLADVKDFEGTYASSASERRSLVGKLWRKDNAVKVIANDDGTITFGDKRYVQIDEGIFAESEGDPTRAVLQFLRDDGKVSALLTADGESFVPLAFHEHGIVATVLFYLLLVAAAWFFFGAIVAFLRWRIKRNKEDSQEGFRHVLPSLIAALISVLVLIQVWVAVALGGAAIASVFNVLALLVLIIGIGALVAFSFSIITSLTNGKIFGREIRTAIIFLVYVFLVCFWGLVLI